MPAVGGRSRRDWNDGLRERLRHVYWLGGGSGAGKSTVARRLARVHGLQVHATDDTMRRHAALLSREEAPYLAAFLAMDPDERWSRRTPGTMLDTFHWYRGEGFRLVVEDLLALPPEPPVVVEGFRLLPRLVAPLLAEPARGVWLLPTPEFRQAAFKSRGGTGAITGRTADPRRALDNLLERDRRFTERLDRQTRELGLPVVRVEVGTSEDELRRRVAARWGLAAAT